MTLTAVTLNRASDRSEPDELGFAGIRPQPVTDSRVDEVEILEQDYYCLPARARRLIEAYAEPRPAPPGWVRFRLAIYRWEEIDRVLHQDLGESSIKNLRAPGASR